jgi:hypothetical protein
MELGITENPALAIEEESIDFKDMIFQGEIPEYDEINLCFSLFLGMKKKIVDDVVVAQLEAVVPVVIVKKKEMAVQRANISSSSIVCNTKKEMLL